MSNEPPDPLAEFRGDTTITGISKAMTGKYGVFQQISQSATADQMAGDPLFYAAFGISDRNQERLQIRQVLGAWHAPGYRYLMDVVYSAQQGTELALAYSFMLVKVTGRHLEPIVA